MTLISFINSKTFFNFEKTESHRYRLDITHYTLRRPVFVDKWVFRRSAASAGALSTLLLRHRPHFDLYRVNASRSS